ncbi:MAG: C25 family cysteine peptidase, partial [Chloroflexi bacterium]|nr:C25 family cysteine peptidase [Chloroflexota bacterium]
MLNWIEVVAASRGEVGEAQLRFESTAGELVELTTTAGERMAIYGEGGSRTVPVVEPLAGAAGRWRARFRLAAGEASFIAVPGERRLRPARIERDLPSRLRATENRADYLMIAHARLLDATRPLAEAHRRRGLAVGVVDVQDVYDEFGHGIVHPRAIRDFVEYAYRHWERPAPRFVLLVGDASWDTKNAVVEGGNYANWPDRQLLTRGGFPSRDAPVYTALNSPNDRNLIPTWNAPTPDGHAASDNYFVAVDGDDVVPDLAIGRFPVTEPAEVEAIVEKTLRYLAAPEAGPWRREVLWVTNELVGFQEATDWLAGTLERRGFTAHKVYPQPEEMDNAEHQRTIQAALERGALLVHFHGHGGRNIWRTGPPDFQKNHDLFTLQHIDELPESGRLPLVLSMTCFSAPFDHPNADSIGEKFLRVAGKGAIAVFAA